MEKEIQVTHIGPDEAAAVMTAAGLFDPSGRSTPASIARGGDCYKLRDGEQEGVFVLSKQGDRLWVKGAAAVRSQGLLEIGFGLVDQIAAQAGCRRIGFQTGRPGVVKLARRKGFKVVGFIMEKAIS